jgi:hypothetical protein
MTVFRVASLKKEHLLHLQIVSIAEIWRIKLNFKRLKKKKPTINMDRSPVLFLCAGVGN